MNSAKGSAQIRRNAIILNTPGAHPKDAEKGRRVITKRQEESAREARREEEHRERLMDARLNCRRTGGDE